MAHNWRELHPSSGPFRIIKDRMSSTFGGPLAGALRSLPLLESDIYLGMQALNLSVVDAFLRDLEADLLREYHELERTPMPSAIFVSALSQLWVFGVYELLRTWRQRVREVMKFATHLESLAPLKREAYISAKRQSINEGSPLSGDTDSLRWQAFEEACPDPRRFIDEAQVAFDRTEIAFRRTEALRIHLAKHETPRKSGATEAMAPGYGRIDMLTGSMTYQVLLRGKEVDLISRQTISDACLEFSTPDPRPLVPIHLRARLEGLVEVAYGVKETSVRLHDGTRYDRVFVAWDRVIFHVPNRDDIPFRSTDIAAVGPEPNDGERKPSGRT
jgi:hypothetical protein